MSNKNSMLIYAIILSTICLCIAVYSFYINENIYNSPEFDYFSGYYEADPSFLELSSLKNMSLLAKKENGNCNSNEYTCKLMWISEHSEESLEEIDVSLNVKKINNITTYIKECYICIQSDIEHPLTNRDIVGIVDIKSGEISMYDTDKSILLASFIKDNAISLYLEKEKNDMSTQ